MLTLVPARGGSKGLPRKNILPLGGIPLIAHTLSCARMATAVSRIIVTTDDPDIRDVALTVDDVEVPFLRPQALAGDDAAAVDVYLHAVDWLLENEKIDVEQFCVLLPTTPLRLPQDVDGAISLFHKRQAEVVVSVCKTKPLGFFQEMADDGKLSDIDGISTSMANRQVLEPSVVLNGAVYVLNTEKLRRTRSYFGARSYGYPMPPVRSIDIDTAADLALAEVLFNASATEKLSLDS
ncbi:MAG: acylneuraminate cytidylyltransferase family protein [Proteobacteria bacterium]|nr:acylneuraminate cytidylyltransferase family protein [Pseudomonadota bacterium]